MMTWPYTYLSAAVGGVEGALNGTSQCDEPDHSLWMCGSCRISPAQQSRYAMQLYSRIVYIYTFGQMDDVICSTSALADSFFFLICFFHTFRTSPKTSCIAYRAARFFPNTRRTCEKKKEHICMRADCYSTKYRTPSRTHCFVHTRAENIYFKKIGGKGAILTAHTQSLYDMACML